MQPSPAQESRGSEKVVSTVDGVLQVVGQLVEGTGALQVATFFLVESGGKSAASQALM